MNKVFVVLIILLAFVMILPNGSTQFGASVVKADTTVFNPNGSSELADLMREMQQYSAEERNRILDAQEGLPVPESFRKIHTAKITDQMNKSEHFNAFSDLYLSAIDNYIESNNKDRIPKFNNMIATCLACHSQNCPGPVPAIRNLLITVE